MQQFEPLRHDFGIQGRYASNIAAGSVEAGNETDRHGIEAGVEDNRNGRGRRLGCKRRAGVGGSDYSDLALNQVCSQHRKSVGVVFRPPVFNRYIPAFDKPGLVQAPMKRDQHLPGVARRSPFEKSNDRRLRLLRARRERPCCHRAKERYERAALHSITSSARASRIGGISRAIAFAVLRLNASLNLVGCCTGRSLGFSPRRMRSTYSAVLRKLSRKSTP